MIMYNKRNKINYLRKYTVREMFGYLFISYVVFYPLLDVFKQYGTFTLFFLWFLFVQQSKKDYLSKVLPKIYLYIIFILILTFRVLLFSDTINTDYFSPLRLISQYSLILIFYMFAEYIRYYCEDKERDNILKYFLISLDISIIISLYYLNNNEYAIRRSFDYDLFAVGDFNLVYTSVFVFGCLFFNFLNNRKSKLTVITMILTAIISIKGGYMTAMILFFITFIICLYFKYIKSFNMRFILLLIMFLLLPILLKYISTTLLKLSSNSEFSTAMRIRFLDIYNMINKTGNINSSNTLVIRLEKAKLSLKTFYENKLFGINYSNYNKYTIGSHTQWADGLARFGIVGNIFLIWQFYTWAKGIYNGLDSISKDSFLIGLILFITLGILNNTMMSGVLTSILVLPNIWIDNRVSDHNCRQ